MNPVEYCRCKSAVLTHACCVRFSNVLFFVSLQTCGNENTASKGVARKRTAEGDAAAAPVVVASNNSFRVNINEVMCADARYKVGSQFMVPLPDTPASQRLLDELRAKAPQHYYTLASTFDTAVWRDMWFKHVRPQLEAARL